MNLTTNDKYYLSNKFEAHKVPPEMGLIHELLHAFGGMADDGKNLRIVDPPKTAPVYDKYVEGGGAVLGTNIVLNQMGLPHPAAIGHFGSDRPGNYSGEIISKINSAQAHHLSPDAAQVIRSVAQGTLPELEEWHPPSHPHWFGA